MPRKLLSGAAAEIRDFDWLTQHVEPNEDVTIANVTDDWGNLVLWEGGLVKCEVRRAGGAPCHPGGVGAMVDYVTEASGNARLPGIMTLGYISAFSETLALAVIAEPLLATLFNHGEFGVNDVLRSAESLRAYSAGLVAFMLIKILAPGYFARQDTRTPVKIGIIAMVANMALNLALIWPLQHAGLALATSLSATIGTGNIVGVATAASLRIARQMCPTVAAKVRPEWWATSARYVPVRLVIWRRKTLMGW